MYHRLFLLLFPLLACNAPAPKPESAPAATIRVPDPPLAVLDTPIRRGGFLAITTAIKRRIEKDSLFKKYIYKEILQSPENPAFRQQKGNLREVRRVMCDSTQYLFADTVAGKSIRLQIRLKPFKKANHKIKYDSDGIDCEEIDGAEPWGGYYGCHAVNEIKNVEFSVSGKKITINKHFKNLYRLGHWDAPYPVMYTDPHAEYFYLFLRGGNAAGSYYAKYVIQEKGVVTQVILSYLDIAVLMSR